MNWCLCQACGKDKIGLRKEGDGCVTVEGERAGGVAALIIKALTPQPVSSCREPLQVLETQRRVSEREAPEVQTTSLSINILEP